MESWPNTPSARAGWSRFDIPVYGYGGVYSQPQSTQSAGPVHFLIFCSISIFLLARLVADRGPQCSAGPPQQRMYSTIPIHWNIKFAPASPGRSRVGPALYVFSLLVPCYSALGSPTCHQATSRKILIEQNLKKWIGPALIVLGVVHYASVRSTYLLLSRVQLISVYCVAGHLPDHGGQGVHLRRVQAGA